MRFLVSNYFADVHFDVITDNSMMMKPFMKQMMPPMKQMMPSMKMKPMEMKSMEMKPPAMDEMMMMLPEMPAMKMPPAQPPTDLPEMEDDSAAIPMPPPVRYEAKPTPLRLNGGYRGVNPRVSRGTPIRNRI